MLRKLVVILFAATMAGCSGSGIPSRSEAEEMLKSNLHGEHLYGYEKKGGDVSEQADFALDFVSGITSPDANTLRVDFMFHWVPTGQAAKKLVALGDKAPVGNCPMGLPGKLWGNVDRWCVPITEKVIGTAVFVKYDDGWRLQRIYA